MSSPYCRAFDLQSDKICLMNYIGMVSVDSFCGQVSFMFYLGLNMLIAFGSAVKFVF